MPSDPDDTPETGVPVFTFLRTFWGLGVILMLCLYSLGGAVNPEPVAATRQASQPKQAIPRPTPTLVPFYGAPNPVLAAEPALTIYLVCDSEDARIVRTYDSPLTGRLIVLRVDQSAGEMLSLMTGSDTVYPKDARILRTRCFDAWYASGALP